MTNLISEIMYNNINLTFTINFTLKIILLFFKFKNKFVSIKNIEYKISLIIFYNIFYFDKNKSLIYDAYTTNYYVN